MDLLLFVLGLLFVLVGLAGAFLPVVPGPPLSWAGLLLLHLTDAVPMDTPFLVITALGAAAVFAADLVLPAWGTKKWGGSPAGIKGSMAGIFLALFIPVLGVFGFLILPFLGALVGEYFFNPKKENPWKAAMGSLAGFVAGTLLKGALSAIYLYYFVSIVWQYRTDLFGF